MLTTLLSSALSLDQTLAHWVAVYGAWAIGIVACVIFAETGLVIAPFLPGDSLLFLTGTVLAAASINVHGAVAVLVFAAIAGDALNFTVGRKAAPWVLQRFGGRWLKPSHLETTHRWFERFGGATIVIARFVPVVRTLAPFLAGAGNMGYRRFTMFNATGAIAWVASLVYAGAFLGSRPFVREHIGSITLGIVFLSLLPMTVAWLRASGPRMAQRRAP